MPSELRAVSRALRLRRNKQGVANLTLWTGHVGPDRICGAALGVGPVRAREAMDELLETGPFDHVVMAGVAGGVADRYGIGAVIVPADVVDARSGRRFAPALPPSVRPAGTLLTSPSVQHGPGARDELVQRGIDAVDMESAAVAEACEDTGTPWSVVRTISDHLADGLVDETILRLLGTDGRPRIGAALGELARHPGQIPRLSRLGRSTSVALRALQGAVASHLAALGDTTRGH